MDFKLILIVTLVASGLISLLDRLFWLKQRQQKLEQALAKTRNLSYSKKKTILAKPEWVNTSDFFFVVASVAGVVWLMLPNFELILVVALAVSLALTLVEKLYMEKRKKADVTELYQRNSNPEEDELEDTRKMPWWVDYGWSFFPLLFLIVALRSFVYEPFKIPSGSMQSTLWVHDFILVNKFEYGLRLPVTKTKLTQGSTPKRGDVIVFRAPHQPDKDFIKRLIALPGDKVYYLPNHQLFIEPNCSTEPARVSAKEAGLACNQRNEIKHRLKQAKGFQFSDVYSETIAGVEHEILIDPTDNQDRYYPELHRQFELIKQQNPEVLDIHKRHFFAQNNAYIEDWKNGVVVPENSYFAMGDNRTGSSDARFWGFIPEERMVGKADYVWLHLEFGFDQNGFFHWVPTGVNFDRVKTIQ